MQPLPHRKACGMFSFHMTGTKRSKFMCMMSLSATHPLLPGCSADSGDLLNPMLLAYWAALNAFCFADAKCFSCPKSYLESPKVKNYRDSRYLVVLVFFQ